MDRETIEVLAIRFRRAAEHADLGVRYERFPTGCCMDISLALARYLKSNGVKDLVYVGAMRNPRSHGWLESNGMIIDITADQFDDCDDSVIVTTKSQFHRTFERDSHGGSQADYRKMAGDATWPHQAYIAVMTELRLSEAQT